jgi:hypothetical protein
VTKRTFIYVRSRLLIIPFVFSLAQSMEAQVDQASVTGTVKDPSGASVEGAYVEAASGQNGKQREVITNSAGVYTIPNLPLGTYTVSIKKAGFAVLTFDSLECRVGSVVTLNATLKLATTRVTAEVISAEPPLNQSSAAVSGIIDSIQIQNLPANGAIGQVFLFWCLWH